MQVIESTQANDQHQRLQALDIRQSFIVQAPAGSGKTELLTQRYLALLAYAVNTPEEIIALTFTRKAAAEMRQRIINALRFAASSPAPAGGHTLQTWQLARNVLSQDKKANWKLLSNPNRLRIQTIDALCLQLARQMPIRTGLGGRPNIVENAIHYYQWAARELLLTLEQPQPWQSSLKRLLIHLDNRFSVVENLLATLLSKRDQWLPYLSDFADKNALKQRLETGLQNIILEILQNCFHSFPKQHEQELYTLANFAADNLTEGESSISQPQNLILKQLPLPTIENYSTWRTLAEWLLTKTQQWRQSVDKRIGFPSAASIDKQASKSDKLLEKKLRSSMKQRFQTLIAALQQSSRLQQALINLLNAPPLYYTSKQWEIVDCLIDLLPVLLAHFTILLKEHHQVDFIETMLSAITALGHEGNPSELALNLDYRIRHLLIDEFQDTSLIQFKLIQQLITGWQPQDGRTIFLVGDPMQSIYRFRQAEVNLFLRARAQGIGLIAMQSLVLSANFRSSATIVNWNNNTYTKIFPATDNFVDGAIAFSKSNNTIATQQNGGVKLYAFNSIDEENNRIIAIVSQNLPTQKTIAILVRSRSQLITLLPALKAANIPFHAVKIEKLTQFSFIRDLYALTCALLHPADRIAWLSLLRAPWCGLLLNDLYQLSQNPDLTIWQALNSASIYQSLSSDGQNRLAKILPIIMASITHRRRLPLREWIIMAWLALEGPHCYQQLDLTAIETYFDLLDQLDQGSDIANLDELNRRLQQLYCSYSEGNQHSIAIQIMTIHKAKGLEFDIVILPSLAYVTQNDKAQLLLWMERPNQYGGNDLILAPIKSSDEQSDAIYDYVKHQSKIKNEHEQMRLLYVATTRAKSQLHLLATLNTTKNEQLIPPSSSFLALLWQQFKPYFDDLVNQNNSKAMMAAQNSSSQPGTQQNFLTRLRCDGNQNHIPNFSNGTDLNKYKIEDENFQQHLGTVIHKMLEYLSKERWQQQKIIQYRYQWQFELIQLGIPAAKIPKCLQIIELAVSQTLADPRGQWILSQAHKEAYSEYRLSAIIDQTIVHYSIDRTFIDEQNQRWIIDYKTATPKSHQTIEEFMEEQKALYQSQLEQYAKIMHAINDHYPIHLGLYFPLIQGWCKL